MQEMKLLTEQRIISLMREEYENHIKNVVREASGIDLDSHTDLVSPELKVIHKDSKVRYTVDAIGPSGVTLRSPEGKEVDVSSDQLEDEFELA